MFQGWIDFTVPALDGPPEEAAERRARTIRRYVTLSTCNSIRSGYDCLARDSFWGVPVNRFPISFELPTDFGVVAGPQLGLAILEIPRYQLAYPYGALSGVGSFQGHIIGSKASLRKDPRRFEPHVFQVAAHDCTKGVPALLPTDGELHKVIGSTGSELADPESRQIVIEDLNVALTGWHHQSVHGSFHDFRH